MATATSNGFNIPLPTSYNGTTVTVNGILAPLLYVSPTQINAQMPAGVSPGTATVNVSLNGQSSSTTATVASSAPGLFAGSSHRANVLHNSTSKPVVASSPARPARKS